MAKWQMIALVVTVPDLADRVSRVVRTPEVRVAARRLGRAINEMQDAAKGLYNEVVSAWNQNGPSFAMQGGIACV